MMFYSFFNIKLMKYYSNKTVGTVSISNLLDRCSLYFKLSRRFLTSLLKQSLSLKTVFHVRTILGGRNFSSTHFCPLKTLVVSTAN